MGRYRYSGHIRMSLLVYNCHLTPTQSRQFLAVAHVNTLQYFFYLNRFVGIVVSLILRALYWRKSNAYFEIGAISFSLLGGEIIFSDVRYISRNQSIRVVKGKSACSRHLPLDETSIDISLLGALIWRYWLRRTRSRDDKPSGRLTDPIHRSRVCCCC